MSEDTCARCDGTGKNSGGRRCGRCGGDGREFDIEPDESEVSPVGASQKKRVIEIDPYNREMTRGQIDIFALAVFSNAHPHERPGYMYGDVWKFRRWDDLSDVQKDEWRRKALRTYATLVAYGMRLVSLDG